MTVHPAWIGQQADFLAFQDIEATLLQDLDAGFDDGGAGSRARLAGCRHMKREKSYDKRRRASKVTETVAIQHIITRVKNPT